VKASSGTQPGEGLILSDLAPGLALGRNVQLADDVSIGVHVVIHHGTRIAAGASIQDLAVVGKPPVVGPRSSAPRTELVPTVVAEAAAVLAGAIVFAGARIEANAIVGDQAHVRERATVGQGSVIGRGSAIDHDVRIGDRVRVQTNCYITGFTVVEDDVFVGPGVTTTNDHTMARLQRGDELDAPVLRRGCRIGGGVTICPGVHIGAEAYVAAGAVVTKDVAPRSVVMGVPAREVREVPPHDRLTD